MSKRYEIVWKPYPVQRPEYADQKIELTFVPYNQVPSWHTPVNGGLVGFTLPGGIFNQVDLATFSNWHTSNASNLYSSNISNRYFYTFDGGANNINDGGFDMYDNGNYISFSTTRAAVSLLTSQSNNYGTLCNITASNFGFFISQSNIWPQISLGYTNSGTIQWRISGGIGTDNQLASSNSNVNGPYSTNNQGRYGSFWANQIYNTSDPSIVMTWFTILQSNLNSVISSCNDNRFVGNPPIDPMNQNFTVTGSNYLFGCFLLSARTGGTGTFIPTNEIQNFISNYVTNANIIIT